MGQVREIDGVLRMQAQSTDISNPILELYETPEILTADSGNLVGGMEFTDGRISLKYDCWELKTTVANKPPYVFPNIFYIDYRLDPNTPFTAFDILNIGGFDPFYSYTSLLVGGTETNKIEVFGMSEIVIQDYFEIRIGLIAWTNDVIVEVDYILVESYEAQVVEQSEYVASDATQLVQFEMLDCYFNRKTVASSVRLYYDNSGGIPTDSSPYLTATGGPSLFSLLFPANTILHGMVDYYIRFETSDGRFVRTPKMRFEVFDNVEPSLGVPDWDPSPKYYEDVPVSIQVTDTGGSHLKHIYITYVLGTGTDPVATSPTKFYSDSAIPVGYDIIDAVITIPSSYLSSSQVFRFKVWAVDHHGNLNGTASIYSLQAVDDVPPQITVLSTTLRDGDTIGDFGYNYNITWRIHEPSQASGFVSTYQIMTGYLKNSIPSVPGGGVTTLWDAPQSTGGIIVQTIPENYVDTIGDVIWYYLYARDEAGNQWNITKSFVIDDRRPPDVLEPDSNFEDIPYNESRVFSFSCSKAPRASPVSWTTRHYYYSNKSPTPNIQLGNSSWTNPDTLQYEIADKH
jgi:hypothetical protein